MLRKRSAALALGLIGLLLSGCYLGHVASGQARLLLAREPIDRVIADPATSAELRESLERVRVVRAYAESLGLSVDRRYHHFAPWPGDRIVTTVVATRPGEVAAAGFWFPILGRVPYKGYFDEARARAEAERLRQDGLDVCEVSVRAYSTLGWFDDPVTGPMLRLPQAQLVETLIHELVHATTYVPEHSDFNEGVASFVGEEGRVRFYAAEEGPDAAQRERGRVTERRLVRGELLRLRDEVHSLYQDGAADEARENRRVALERAARERLAALPLQHRDPTELATALRLNDACLALAATYAADTACYAKVLAARGGDLPGFVDRVRTAAAAEEPREHVLGDTPCS